MFDIAALGSHRPRAIIEHGDLCRAIIARDPDQARRMALRLLGNATSDIDRIMSEMPGSRKR
jgi:DNA-binding GntR family transcriptional regulator